MKPFENHIKAVLIFFCIYLLSLSVETFRGDWVGYNSDDALILNKKSGVIKPWPENFKK